MKKKFIIKVLSLVMKMSTLKIPSEYVYTLCDEGIDEFANMLLDIPEGMPTPQKYKDDSNEVIVTLVEDLISEADISINPENIVLVSVEQLTKMIMNNNKALKWHEDINKNLARNMLLQYLNELKEWSVQQPDLVCNSFEIIHTRVLAVERVVEHQVRLIDGVKEQMEQNTEEIQQLSVKMESERFAEELPSICSYDVYESRKKAIRNQFYQYFIFDKSISVDKFFWSTNYKLQLLDGEKFLSEKLKEEGSDLDTEQAIKLVGSNPLVLITGLYGTGKTALLKRLHYELVQERHERVVYLLAKDILEIMHRIGFNPPLCGKARFKNHDMDSVFESIDYESQSIYILIDELDELNQLIHETISTSYLDVFSAWLSKFLISHNQFHFVLSSRIYAQIGRSREECVADTIFVDYYDTHESPLNVIYTECFDSHTRDEWIKEYARNNNLYASDSSIGNVYGKLPSALSTPIFLYAFMQKYLSGTPDLEITGYYYYFSHFIQKTVGGKFGDQKAIERGTDIQADRYRAMLRKLAYCILRYSKELLTAEIYGRSFNEEELLLEDKLTKRKFEIPLANLNDSELLALKKHEAAYSVNSFFLKMDRSRVYFTDTNILFCLASEYVFVHLEELIAEGKTTFHNDHLSQIEIFHLYPHLIDYIIYLTKQSPFTNEICNYLDSFVTDFNTKAHTVDLLQENRIDKILLLYILFLKTKKGSYNVPAYQHVIKEIIYYVNAYKTVNYRFGDRKPYAIERYFMKLRLHHATFRRINLKGYNFQGSIITDKCEFHQCKFQSTNMYDVIMDGTYFTLCEFKDADKVKFIRKRSNASDYQAIFDTCDISRSSITAQSVAFRNCKIDGFVLEITGEQTVEFENCFIKKITINPQSDKSKGIPRFTRCIFEKKPTIRKYKRDAVEAMLERGKNIVLEGRS